MRVTPRVSSLTPDLRPLRGGRARISVAGVILLSSPRTRFREGAGIGANPSAVPPLSLLRSRRAPRFLFAVPKDRFIASLRPTICNGCRLCRLVSTRGDWSAFVLLKTTATVYVGRTTEHSGSFLPFQSSNALDSRSIIPVRQPAHKITAASQTSE